MNYYTPVLRSNLIFGGLMKKIWIAIAILLTAATAIYFACGGGFGSSVGDTVIVREAASMPTIDISGIDIISPPSSSISKVSETPAGYQSSTGCLLKEIFNPDISDTLKQTQLSNCLVTKAQDSNSKFVIPLIESTDTDLYAYYQITLGETAAAKTGIKDLRVRLANVSDGTSSKFMIDTCQSADGSVFTRSNQFEIQGSISTKTWSGTTVAHNIDGNDDTNCTTTPCFFQGASFAIVMNSAGDLENDFSWSNVSSAAITGYRGRNPTTADVTDETTFDYLLDIAFAHTALDPSLGVPRQSINGAVDIPGNTIKSASYSIFTANDGASKLSHDNGQGIYDDTQAFNPAVDPITIIDTAGVTYYDTVADATVPSADIAAAVRENVAFTNTWDCEPPSDRAFTEIDAATYDFTDCEKLISALPAPSVGAFNKCFGDESLAGNYSPYARMGCPGDSFGAGPATLTGYGPTYRTGTGINLVEFVYQNSYCSNPKIGDIECIKCERNPPGRGPGIYLENCGTIDPTCEFQMTTTP